MKKLVVAVAVALALVVVGVRSAEAGSIGLSNYTVAGVFPLALTAGAVSGLEASAVTYARDRGSLFYVGDEGTGVVEVSLTGQTIGSMAFDWTGAGSSNHDSEGLTYLGGGQLVLAEERLQNLYSFVYAPNGTVIIANTPFVSIGPTIGNIGIEGVSVDPRNGNFFTVKQDDPAQLRSFNSLTFTTVPGADVVPNTVITGPAMNSSLFGLTALSDVSTLGIVDALAGSDTQNNLLILSLESRSLIEITRSGTILSSLSLAGILPRNGIEGVTVDERGTIYLVAEQDQMAGAPPNPQSQLIVLTAAPEPATCTLVLSGLGALGWKRLRRKTIRLR